MIIDDGKIKTDDQIKNEYNKDTGKNDKEKAEEYYNDMVEHYNEYGY